MDLLVTHLRSEAGAKHHPLPDKTSKILIVFCTSADWIRLITKPSVMYITKTIF